MLLEHLRAHIQDVCIRKSPLFIRNKFQEHSRHDLTWRSKMSTYDENRRLGVGDFKNVSTALLVVGICSPTGRQVQSESHVAPSVFDCDFCLTSAVQWLLCLRIV